MTDPLQNSADGFSNISYSAGGFVDRVINKLSPEIWGGPYYGNEALALIRWSLTDLSTYDKNEEFPPSLGTAVFYGPLDEISYWDLEAIDPKVMRMQNKVLIDFGTHLGADIVLRSVDVSWRINPGTPIPGNVWAWGRLDEDVELQQYDTPVIKANKLNIGITYWTPPLPPPPQ